MSFFLDKNDEISFIISNSRVNAPDATHNVDFWPLFPSKIVGQAMEKQEGNFRLYILTNFSDKYLSHKQTEFFVPFWIIWVIIWTVVNLTHSLFNNVVTAMVINFW